MGGVSSRLGGGKFQNGAVTAAFGRLFNHELSSNSNEIADQGRLLNDNEIAAARAGYGDQIKDYDSVRIYSRKWMPFQGAEVAMAPDGNIYWPAAKDCADLTACIVTSKAGYKYSTHRTFIHEMGHVMQHQQGINVALHALPLHIARGISLGLYDPYMDRSQFDRTPSPSGLNVEAQADWYMHSYCEKTGKC